MEENEDESNPTKFECSITVCVTVCKKEEGKYCLDFVLREGEKEAFDQHYQELVDDTEKLWPYNNAWIEEKQEKKQ